MNTKEYKDRYVAFLDLLGFKNMINYKKCNDLYSIFDLIKNSSHTSVLVNDKVMKTFESIEYTIMSDSIIVYVDADLDDALFSLLCTCQTIQMTLLNRGILLRGGIAHGSLFREEYVIFGQGLSSAYLLENNIASFPRIVFNQKLLDEGNLHNVEIPQGAWSLMLTAQDDDELYYINPVSVPRIVTLIKDPKNVPDYLDGILSMCQNTLDSTYDQSIRNKYLWLKNKTIKEIKVQYDYILNQCSGAKLIQKWNIQQP